MRFVFDTNVIVSAALFEGSRPAQAFRSALRVGEVLISVDLLDELNEVLRRPKFERYILADERERFLEAVLRRGRLVEVVDVIDACRDPKDNKILELAVSGKADYIVSGDKDLLVLHPFRAIPIGAPGDFMLWLSQQTH